MNKISSIQLFTLLLGVKMFSIICSASSADAEQMAGAAVSATFQMLAAVPMIALYRQSGFSLKKEMLFGRFGKLLYCLYFILWGAVSLENLWGVTKSVYFPIDSSLTGAVILAAVSIYCASLGIKSVSRSSTVMLGFIVLSVGIMLLGAYPKADPANFVPAVSVTGMLKKGIGDFCSSGELVMLFILLDIADKNREKGAFRFFLWKLVLTEIIFAVEITVLGRIMGTTDFPFFTAGAFSQPFSIQRADSLYMIVFTMLCVMTVTLQILLSSSILKEIFPELKYTTLISAVLMAGSSAGIRTLSIDISPVMGILIIILAVVMPLIMYIRRKTGNEKASAVTGSGNNAAKRVQQ
ncbi:MAG: GerAB/ArcD/ProY family transporter [Porcipelethomonas sp.]